MALKNKRYFWIQLAQDFFKSKEMKLLRKIAGGDTHTIIYLKMMLISLEDGGHIYYDGLADNLAEEIALVIDENVEDIK
ncbi:phage replisome organizer N-terminal domain-containing protein, partial [Streptococcus pneumoniae]